MLVSFGLCLAPFFSSLVVLAVAVAAVLMIDLVGLDFCAGAVDFDADVAHAHADLTSSRLIWSARRLTLISRMICVV